MGAFELDHLMVCTMTPDVAMTAFLDFGLQLGLEGAQPGTGARHALFYFDNAYVELAWPEAPDSAFRDAPAMHFCERADAGVTGWCPFGIALRGSDGLSTKPQIATWPYAAPFLPPEAVPIPIGANSALPNEPLLIVSLVASRPDRRSPRPPLQRHRGLGEISHVRITLPGTTASSPELSTLESFEWCSVDHGTRHHVELEIDDGRFECTHDFGPNLPVSFRW